MTVEAFESLNAGIATLPRHLVVEALAYSPGQRGGSGPYQIEATIYDYIVHQLRSPGIELSRSSLSRNLFILAR